MANNLFVSYQLQAPERADDVDHAIEILGRAVKLYDSLWLVDSSYSAGDAADRIRAAMAVDDRLVVVDASNDRMAWFNLSDDVSCDLDRIWNPPD